MGKRARWVLWMVACLACLPCATEAIARPAAAEFSGLVSLADGGPFTLIRGDSVQTGVAGVTLVSGDILETLAGDSVGPVRDSLASRSVGPVGDSRADRSVAGQGNFLVIEVRGGNLLAVGPGSEIYFLPRAEITTLVVLKGWVKADVRATSKPGALRILGTRLGVQVQKAVVLLRADARSDAIFAEQGSGTLLIRDGAVTHTDREIQPNQFLVREDKNLLSQPRPSADFIADMPVPFRDALPANASARLKKAVEPRVVREVSYADVQSWLTMPRDWRAGLIPRFRARLKDQAFFAAMDAHLPQHPEWAVILHPPPPLDPSQSRMQQVMDKR